MDIINSVKDNNVKLQSILFPKKHICTEEALYLHREEGFVLFDGYFNLFYLEKYHKYCDIDELTLELVVSGIKCIYVMHDRDVILEQKIEVPAPSGMDRLKGKLPSIEDDSRISIKLPYTEYDKGVFWFKVEIDDNCSSWSVAGHISAKSNLESRNVKLAVDICTYKREQYVVRNLQSLLEYLHKPDIDGEVPEISEHLKVFIVDNAKSLDHNPDFEAVKRKGVKSENECLVEVIPNANTGGAGGFTRGMEEVVNRKDKEEFTHILLMDDDASFDPDLFTRIFGILSMLRTQYKDLTIGGSLWRQDYPFIQFASGEWFDKLEIINEMYGLDLRSFDKCTRQEMCTAENELKRYSGWWCCCYSLSVVKKDNLPISQMFIHRDDIEYEMRNRKNGNPVVFFAGIGVWHKSFDIEFQGVKTYYNTRNTLIMTARLNPELGYRYIKKRMCRMLFGNGVDNRYLKMHLIYMGIMDFLKGKEWFENLDTEKHHQNLLMFVRRFQDNYLVSDINDHRLNGVREEIAQYTSGPVQISQALYKLDHDSGNLPFIVKATLNGLLLPHKKEVTVVYPYDPLWTKGYRTCRYVFVQNNPVKMFFVKTKASELCNMVYMLIMIWFKFRKSSWEQFQVRSDR